MQPECHACACAISIESAFWDLVNTARVLAISEGRQSPSIHSHSASDAVLAIFHHRQLSWNATSTHMPQSLTESYIRRSIFPLLFVAHRSGWVLPEKGGRGRGASLLEATFFAKLRASPVEPSERASGMPVGRAVRRPCCFPRSSPSFHRGR